MTLLFLSCSTDETTTIEIEEKGEKTRVELFTRADSYNLPSLRSLANESGLNKTPWVIVFKKDASNDFIYEEAVQAFEITGIDKRYVDLTKQTDACKILILINTQTSFYVKGNIIPQTFSEANFDTQFTEKKLEEVSALLYSQPLNNPEITIPYSMNNLLPMSQIVELNGGIDNNTQLGTTGNPLQLERIVAKIVVNNTASSFKFKGITAVINAPEETLLHRLSGVNPENNDNQDLVEYRKDNTYSTELIQAASESTTTSPIYLYESRSGTTNDTYLIIKGEYEGIDYYYKMILINSNLAKIDVQRNHLYTFTIKDVSGRGFLTVEDAKKSNVSSNFTTIVTVTDGYSHEIISNDDYYLALTNSVFISYSDDNQRYTISSCANNCEINFIDHKISILDDSNNTLSLFGSNEIPIVTSSTSNPVIKDIVLDITPKSNSPWNTIGLLLGNLDKEIYLKQNPAVSASGETLIIKAPKDNISSFYYVSGYVVEDVSKDWIKLISSLGEIRNDSSDMTVSDGVINVYIEPNKTNTIRQGTVFLTAYNQANKIGENLVRIKLDIRQKKN